MWRNYRISLSLANLVYARAWADLIPRSSGLFHRKTLPGFSLYFALVGDVLALSLLIFLLIRLAPRLPGWLRRIIPVAAMAMMALAASFLRTQLLHYVSAKLLGLFLALLFVVAAALALRFSSLAVRLIKGVALAATPCVAVTFAAPLYYLSRPSPLPPDPPLARRLSGSPPVRVLWFVFDDWDQRLTFGGPDAEGDAPQVPAILSLAERSFAATGALAAQAGTTDVTSMATVAAIPSLLYGKLAIAYESVDPATRRILFAGNDVFTGNDEPVVFGAGDSIFARVRSHGWNSAVAGWFLPYCRVFASQLTDCYWDEMYDQASSASHAPLEAAVDETRMLFETQMYSPFGRSLVEVRHFEEYRALVTAAKRYAADPSLGLAFVHFNVPHPPYFYNPDLGHFGRKGHPDDLYIDELKWVDRAVSEVLASLNSSGLDSRTAIILSSDHPARLIAQTDPHVPFIVHLPGYEAGVASSEEFSALRTADLVLAIATGEVRSPLDIQNFLRIPGPRK